MSESILYYPTIDICDGAWLRSAVLYWDEICSIVPYENYTNISPELLYLHNCGYYRPIYPQEVFLLGDPYEFSRAVEHYFAPFLRSKKRLFVGGRKVDRVVKIYNPDITTLIHYNKIPRDIIRLFNDSGLITTYSDGWLEMDAHIAQRYMKLLAEFIIKHDKKDIVLGSNTPKGVREMYPKPFGQNAGSNAISLTLEKCLPIPIMDIGIEDLLFFKERHRDELLSLQLQIIELEKRIAKAENILDIKRELTEFRKSWELELVQTEKLFKGHGIRYTLGSLRSFIQDAGAIAGITQWVQNGFQNLPSAALGTFIGVNGLICIGSCAMNYQNRIRTTAEANGFAYIVSAKKAGLLSNNKASIEMI